VEALVWQDGRQQEFERLIDHELLTMASRETLVAISLGCAVLRSQLPSLIETKATETATLMNAIAAAFSAAKDSLAGPTSARAGRSGRERQQ
jgi:hypothetical protein